MRKSVAVIGVSFFVFSLLFSTWVAAASRPAPPKIEVQFDRDAVLAGEPFGIEVSVTAEGESDPQVSIPDVPGLRILKKSVSRPMSAMSFSFSFGSGQNARTIRKSSGTTRISLVAVCSKPGQLVFGPVQVVLDGFTFKGNQVPFEVYAPDAQPGSQDMAASGGAVDAGRQGSLTSEHLAGANVGARFFLHMIPSKKTVSQGEMVVVDLFLFTKVGDIRLESFDREPGTEGFWVERFEDFDLRNYRNQQVMLNDELYEQVLLKRLALFPQKSGHLVVSPATVTINEGQAGFLGMIPGRSYQVTSAPLAIDVTPFPEGSPSGFDQANVGAGLSFFVNTEHTTVKAKEPVTVTITLKGSGNIRALIPPNIDPIDGVKSYPPEDEVTVLARNRKVSGMKQRKVLLIPQKEGDFTIPAISWSYFDVASSTYRTLHSKPIVVTVKGNAGGGGGGGSVVMSTGDRKGNDGPVAGSLSLLNSQLRTIDSSVSVEMRNELLVNQLWWRLLVLLLPVGFLFGWGWRKISERRAQAVLSNRSGRALLVANKGLKALERTAGQQDGGAVLSQAQRIFVTFLQDWLEAPIKGDTMTALAHRLDERGVEQSLIDKVVSTMEAFEFARFARTSGHEEELASQLKRLGTLMGQLHKSSLKPNDQPGRRG